jgi:hypothetical protein
MKLRAAAMAACLVGTGTAARAYDYVDSRGYRHWCQLSCERKGIHVPKSGEVKSGEGKSGEGKSGEVKSGEVKSDEVKSDEVKSGEVKPRQRKVIDENDLAWEPPPGVKWQVVPETPSRANTKLFKPGEIAKQDKRP